MKVLLSNNLIKIYATGIVLSSSNLYAADIDQSRMLLIAESVIQMQIINDPQIDKHLKTMAERIVNSKDPKDTALVLDSIPRQGIAQHLIDTNTQGMVDEQKKRLTTELYKQINLTSAMFKTCKVQGNIRQVNPHLYAVSITCQIPNPSSQAIKYYHRQMAKFDPEIDLHEYRIHHFNYSHRIETLAEKQAYNSELLIDTSVEPIYKPVIQNNDYFPIVMIDKVDNLFIKRKVATARDKLVSIKSSHIN